jgi:hypothetical protein
VEPCPLIGFLIFIAARNRSPAPAAGMRFWAVSETDGGKKTAAQGNKYRYPSLCKNES